MQCLRLAALLSSLAALLLATQADRTELPNDASIAKIDPDEPFGGPLRRTAPLRDGSPDYDALVQLIESAIHRVDSQQLTEPSPKLFVPPITATELRAFLSECLRDILEHSRFRRQREFYGTPGDDVVVLIDDEGLAWPTDLPRALGGYRLQYGSSEARVVGVDHRLAIRLDELDVAAPRRSLFGDGNARFSIQSLPGEGSTIILGGCSAWFNIERVDGNLIVTPGATLDP